MTTIFACKAFDAAKEEFWFAREKNSYRQRRLNRNADARNDGRQFKREAKEEDEKIGKPSIID